MRQHKYINCVICGGYKPRLVHLCPLVVDLYKVKCGLCGAETDEQFEPEDAVKAWNNGHGNIDGKTKLRIRKTTR